jgi:hypothetical protein
MQRFFLLLTIPWNDSSYTNEKGNIRTVGSGTSAVETLIFLVVEDSSAERACYFRSCYARHSPT